LNEIGTLQVATVVITLLYLAPLYSAIWAACFGWSSEAKFPTHPGHWLLISVGVSFCERMLTLETEITDFDWHAVTVPLRWLPSCLVAIRGLRTAPTPSWRGTFQYLVALRIAGIAAVLIGVLIRLSTEDQGHWSFELFASSFMVIFFVLSGAALIRIMMAQTADIEAKTFRGAIHTLGVALACFDLILPWPWWRMLH
jgi:cation transport ATPase